MVYYVVLLIVKNDKIKNILKEVKYCILEVEMQTVFGITQQSSIDLISASRMGLLHI